MNPSDRFDCPAHTRSGKPTTEPVPVRGRADIPRNAPADRTYRVEGVVVSVAERVTRDEKRCFFLKVRDAAGELFFVVVWDWQWARLRLRVDVDRPAVLDVRPPAGGHSAFTLA